MKPQARKSPAPTKGEELLEAEIALQEAQLQQMQVLLDVVSKDWRK